MPSNTSPGLLDDHLTREQLADEWGVHQRTVARYEALPDGLPYLMIGGRKWYPVDGARAFMARRRVNPNPTRRAG